MSKRYVGLAMMIIGISVMAAGLGLSGYNLWDNYRAGIQAYTALNAIVKHREETVVTDSKETTETPIEFSLDFDRELPILEMDGHRYIGTVSIPAIDASLPVQEDWGPAWLKISPCRYKGSPYRRDLIICAHNYDTHFGQLKNLLPGDEVIFTDTDGNEFRHIVVELETLDGTDVEEMESGEWDLTLFTCSPGGQKRVTVRCDLLENNEAYNNRLSFTGEVE